MKTLTITFYVVALIGLQVVPAKAVTLVVPGAANIYGAGHTTLPSLGVGDGGVFPTLHSFAQGSTPAFTFSSTGLVSYNGGGNFYGAEGGAYGEDTTIDSTGGISGIRHDSRVMFLVGVFLDDSEPTGPAPSILDFTNDSFSQVAPVLAQTFFIGDGLTGDGSGEVQQFNVPTGATRLFLGFADGFDFSGPPGLYADNIQSLSVTAQSIPEPSRAVLALLGLGAVLVRRRR